MAFTRALDDTRPNGALVDASQIDDEIRAARVDYHQRLSALFEDPDIDPPVIKSQASLRVNSLTGKVRYDGSLAGDTYTYESAANVLDDVVGNVNVFRRTALGVSVSGTLNVTGTITGNVTGNVTGNLTGAVTGNASTATILANTRTIWGQNFNGAGNVSGALTGVTDLTASGTVTAATALAIAATTRFYFDGVAASGDTYASESSANNLRFTVGNVNVVNFTALGASVTGTFAASGNTNIGGNLIVTGTITAASASAVWIAATMINGWTGQIYYWKDSFGIVHLFSPGGLTRINVGTWAAVLPVGYRPTALVRFIFHSADVGGNQTPGYGEVDTSGNVLLDNRTGYQNYTHIDGFSFAT